MSCHSRTFIIADTHFGHKNIIQYCKRPFTSIQEMDDTMISNWNQVVGHYDLVYHLGDFALASGDRVIDLVKQLNGEIILIRGNHDRAGKSKLLSYGFKEVCKRLDIGSFILTHRPLPTLPQGKINLHGHVHNLLHNYDGYVCFSVEATNYYPIPFEFSNSNHHY